MSRGTSNTTIESLRRLMKQEGPNRGTVGTVEKILLDRVVIRLRTTSQLLRGIRVVGGVSTVEEGDEVFIIYADREPVALSTRSVTSDGAALGQRTHNHDNRYYSQTEVDDLLNQRSPVSHIHTDPFTEAGWEFADGVIQKGNIEINQAGYIIIGDQTTTNVLVLNTDVKDDTRVLWAGNLDPDLANFAIDETGGAYIRQYVENHMLDLELMKISFQAISWSQFAVFDSFEDESKRANPDPSTYDARVLQGKLDNGNDVTASRSFGFVSKIYTNITSVYSGVSTGVGAGYLDDTTASEWFSDKWKGYELVDSALSVFAITGNTTTRLTLASGTPAAGAYTLRSVLPAYTVGFCSFDDATQNGGYGYVKLEISFNGGTNYQTLLDTEVGVNRLEGTVAIANPGRDYVTRLTLKNNALGQGPLVHKFLVCTDPSVWQ